LSRPEVAVNNDPARFLLGDRFGQEPPFTEIDGLSDHPMETGDQSFRSPDRGPQRRTTPCERALWSARGLIR
jgi:hypothetical protein